MNFDALPEIAQRRNPAGAGGGRDATRNAPYRKASEFSANVRMGEVETLKEAGSRGAGCGC